MDPSGKGQQQQPKNCPSLLRGSSRKDVSIPKNYSPMRRQLYPPNRVCNPRCKCDHIELPQVPQGRLELGTVPQGAAPSMGLPFLSNVNGQLMDAEVRLPPCSMLEVSIQRGLGFLQLPPSPLPWSLKLHPHTSKGSRNSVSFQVFRRDCLSSTVASAWITEGQLSPRISEAEVPTVFGSRTHGLWPPALRILTA